MKNPLIMLARIWNHLPDRIIDENYNLFVKKLKFMLMKYMFYDMHKFFSCNFDA
jgi:hypothetical protein